MFKRKEEQIWKTSLEKLNWKYGYLLDTKIETKSSVSKLKNKKANITNEINFEEPKFLKDEIKISSARKGTLMHLILQNISEKENYTIEKITKLNPEHISTYSLILEEGTPLEKMVKENKLEMLSDEEERKMYWYVKVILEKHKYYQYEISNFARPGFESVHNSDCWKQKEYIGIGAAASSFLEDKRYSNIQDLEQYIENIEKGTSNKNLVLEETLNLEAKMKEYMLLGLRRISGVNIFEFEKKFNVSPIVKFCKELEKLNHEGLIIVIDENIKLTNKGIDLANLVWEEFV